MRDRLPSPTCARCVVTTRLKQASMSSSHRPLNLTAKVTSFCGCTVRLRNKLGKKESNILPLSSLIVTSSRSFCREMDEKTQIGEPEVPRIFPLLPLPSRAFFVAETADFRRKRSEKRRRMMRRRRTKDSRRSSTWQVMTVNSTQKRFETSSTKSSRKVPPPSFASPYIMRSLT